MSLSSIAFVLALQVVPFDPAVFTAPHVTLDGLVRRPGGCTLQKGDTVGAVLSRAGGITTGETPTYILIRTKDGEQVSCVATPGEPLETRDNVIVVAQGSPFPIPATRCENALARVGRQTPP